MSDLSDEDREALVRLALDAIKAIHRNGGRALSRTETIAFLENPPHLLNGGERLPAGKRGARTKRTYYDLRHEKLRGHYHRIKRLPDAGAAARRKAGEPLRAFILRRVDTEAKAIPEATPRSYITGLVMRALQLKGDRFDRRAVRDALLRLGRI